MTSPPPHDHDVTMRRGGPSLVDRGGQIVDEGEAHPERVVEPNVRRRRVGTYPSSDIVISAITFGIRSPLGDDQWCRPRADRRLIAAGQ